MRMHIPETAVDFVNRAHAARLDVFQQPLDFALRGNQARDVHPVAVADFGVGGEQGLHLRVGRSGRQVLEALNQRVAEELAYAGVVEPDALGQGVVGDFGAVERIHVRQFAGSVTQVVEGLEALDHFLYREGTQEVVVDAVQLLRVLAGVSAGPLLGVAYGTDAAEVDARHEEGRVVLLDEVGEGQVGRVGVGHVPSHHQRERSHPRGPEHVGVGCGLGAPLQDALVDGAELVHMVALVGTGPGVHKREHPRDEQRRFVVRHGEGPCEDGAGLAVLAVAVAEEQGVGSRVAVRKRAGLAHEAAGHHRVVFNLAAGGEDEVGGYHAAAHAHGVRRVGIDAAVVEPACAFEGGAVADGDVRDAAAVADAHVPAHASDGAAAGFGIAAGKEAQVSVEAAAVAVHRHNVCGVGAEVVGDDDFPAAGLVEHGHFDAVAETGLAPHRQHIDVVHEGAVADFIVGDVLADLAYEHAVADGHVVQEGVAHPVAEGDAAFEAVEAVETAEAHVPGEGHVDYAVGPGILAPGDPDLTPVVTKAAVAFEGRYFRG